MFTAKTYLTSISFPQGTVGLHFKTIFTPTHFKEPTENNEFLQLVHEIACVISLLYSYANMKSCL